MKPGIKYLVVVSAGFLLSQGAFAALSSGKGGTTTSGSDHWGTTYSGGACIGDSTGGKSGATGSYKTDNGCVPYVAGVDDDGDSMPSTWELTYNLNKYNSQDRFMDVDSDGSTNSREYASGTEPSGTGSSDTDDDGTLDGEDPNPTSAGSSTFNLDATYKGINIQQTIDAN